MSDSKTWTNTAGPLKSKRAVGLLRTLANERQTYTELTGVIGGEEDRTSFAMPFGGGPAHPVAAKEWDDLHATFGGVLTNANLAAVEPAAEAAIARARAGRPVVDKRRQPAEEARLNAKVAEREAKEAARRAEGNARRAAILAKRPTWAAQAIVAEAEADRSDSMTDYFATETTRTVVIGWRRGKREDFRQLRAVAAGFPATAHLGPGKDRWTAAVVHTHNVQDEVGNYHHQGSHSHWHQETPAETFGTEAEARAYADKMGAPAPIMSGDQEMRFEWRFTCESVEHRDNFSMGGGNYLKASSAYSSGWVVCSRHPEHLPDNVEDGLDAAPPPPAPAPAPDVTTDGSAPTVRASTVKPGNVEVTFPAKPAEDVRAELKRAGFRWHGPAGCWYGAAAALPARYHAGEVAMA